MIAAKTEEEIELLREPCRIVKECLDFVGANIRAGMTTKEVDDLASLPPQRRRSEDLPQILFYN